MDTAIKLRQKLHECDSLRFSTEIVSDYGDNLYSFQMNCIFDDAGDISFSVTSPDTISGISGTIDAKGGEIQFDQEMLAFPLLIDGQLSPICTPWVILNCLRSGYLSSCGSTAEGIQLIIDDTIQSNNIRCLVWLDQNHMPNYSEIVWNGRRILSASIKDVVIL